MVVIVVVVVIAVVVVVMVVVMAPAGQFQDREPDTRGDQDRAHDRVLGALDR